MNNVILLGRLTKDPELRFTNAGRAVCHFTLAVKRQYTSQNGQRETDFISVVLWGKPAEYFEKSVCKGQRVLVEGSIRTNSYVAKDGTKRYVTEVYADSFEYIEKRDDYTPNPVPSLSGSDHGYESMGTPVKPEDEIPFF